MGAAVCAWLVALLILQTTLHVHPIEIPTANTGDRDDVPRLLRRAAEVVYGDTGYTGMSKHPEIAFDLHLSSIDCRTSTRNRFHHESKVPGID